MLPMIITCRPSRSFFLFSFCFIFYVCKNYTSIVIYEKNFFFVHLHSYTQQTFSVHTRIKKLFLYISTWSIKTLFLFEDFFFSFFNIHSWFYTKNFFIYTHCSHKNFFSHIVYIQKFLFFSLYTDMTFCSQRLFLSLFLALLRCLFVLF